MTTKAPAKKAAAKPATTQQLTDYARTNYGYLAAFLDIPEVRTILLSAAKGKWDEGKLRGALYATHWWKSTTETMRQWDALKATDPHTAQQKLDQTKAGVLTAANAQGITLSDADAAAIALRVNRLGWTDQQVKTAVASHFTYTTAADQNAAGITGQAEVTVDGLRSHANQYLVPLSDATITTWTRHIMDGTQTMDAFDSYLKDQAKSLFPPSMSASIDAGMTPQQYLNPYREMAANLLEKNPDDIDFTKPMWQRAINQVDAKTGERSPMSLADWQTTLMTDKAYGYDKTQGAVDTSLSLSHGIARLFGSEA